MKKIVITGVGIVSPIGNNKEEFWTALSTGKNGFSRITRFDACLGGIGGCPHAPGASGNVATEDLGYMLASMGIETGQDIDGLLALRGRLAQWLAGERLHGTLWRAGLPKTMRQASADPLTTA